MADIWDLSSGMVDTFDGQVTEAWFTFDDSYNNGETCVLKLLVKADELGTFTDDNTTTLLFPLGKGWEPTNKGSQATHESGSPKQFNRSSGMGLIINSAKEIGLVDQWREQDKSPLDANIWEGVHCQWHNTEFSWTTQDGEKRSYYRMLPTALLHTNDTKPVEDTPDFDISPMLRGKLRAIATNAESHDAFIEAAFIADLDFGPNGEQAVMSHPFYESLRKG